MSEGSKSQLAADRLLALLEAVMFSSGEPVRPEEIAAAVDGLEARQVLEAAERLERRYAEQGAGLRVERIAGGLQLATRPDVGHWVRQFFRQRNRTRVTPSTLETLAIVAYRQPVTAPEIQSIRGKDPTYALKTLLEKKLIRMMGKKKVVGRPILYGTSRQFLVHFGLDSLEDLPAFEEFEALVEGVAPPDAEPPAEAGPDPARPRPSPPAGVAAAPPSVQPAETTD